MSEAFSWETTTCGDSIYPCQDCGNGRCEPCELGSCQIDCGCRYSPGWWPYWPGQDDLPPVELRVLINGVEFLTTEFCYSGAWEEIGDLRRRMYELVVQELEALEFKISIPATGIQARWVSTSFGVTKVPLETLLFATDLQSGGIEFFALGHDFEGFVYMDCYLHPNCPDALVQFSAPVIFVDGVFEPFLLRVNDYSGELPHVDVDSDLVWPFVGPFEQAIEDIFLDPKVKNRALELIADLVEEKSPNNLFADLFGFENSTQYINAVDAVARYLQAVFGIDLALPPIDFQARIYIRMPPSDGSSGGEITLAVFTG